MNGWEALLLGLLQGLTEYLPISSSGHLIIGKVCFGIETQGAAFEVMVHTATVFSTITVFRKEIGRLLSGLFKLRYNNDTRYILQLLLSMVPILVVGLFFKSQVEELFGNGLTLVGSMLLVTAILLLVTQRLTVKETSKAPELTYKDAFIMGLSQAIAVLPGLSRSGVTISTGLLLGKERAAVAKFSFMMVLVPILGEVFLDIVRGGFAVQVTGIPVWSLLIGFVAAYFSGLAACSVMLNLVKKAKLWGFALYCTIVGAFCLLFHFLT